MKDTGKRFEVKTYSPGQPVRIGGEDGDGINATINAICIRRGLAVTYEVVWWSGRDRKSEWVSEEEVVAVMPIAPLSIGFASEGA